MPQTSREIVKKTIRFESPERIPYDLHPDFGSDFYFCNMSPSPDARPIRGRDDWTVDEWGSIWENIGVSNLGEVKEFPLKDWADWDQLTIPDITEARRWTSLEGVREQAGDKFLIGAGIALYERVHFIRGLENTWLDIHQHPEELGRLIDILVEMNLYAIEQYAALGADGYMFADDWGFQQGLMISPKSWQKIWKPRYAKIFEAAHKAGLQTFLHSCGDISSILADLIEIGLDVVQMDQQENMGLETLGETFGGKITFWCPVDIQKTMSTGSLDEIRAYCRSQVEVLGRPEGGFMAQWYSDPVGAGHRPEAVQAMCAEYVRLSTQK